MDSGERTDLDDSMISDAVDDAVDDSVDDPGTGTDTHPVNQENPVANTNPVVSPPPSSNPAPPVSPPPSSNPAPPVSTNQGNPVPGTEDNSPASQTASVGSTDPNSYGDWLNTRFENYGMNFVGSGGNYYFQQGQGTDLRVYHPHSSSNFDGATFAGVVAGKVRDTGVQKSGTVSISFTADGPGATDFNLDISGINELVDMSGHITAGEVQGVRYWRIYEVTHGYHGGQRHSQRIDANFYNRNRLLGKIQSWIGASGDGQGGFVGFIGTKKQF